MSKLPLKLVLDRLSNEEMELKKVNFVKILSIENYCNYHLESCKNIELETIYGKERLEVIKKYRIEIKARGYDRTTGGIVVERNVHIVDIYILRNYPFVDRKVGAPVRLKWISSIFHPNISPGIETGGAGIVCWRILQEWLSSFGLVEIVSGLKNLIENPNPDDALLFPETREAIEWFSRRKSSPSEKLE